ncbi:MAG: glycosyltransferase family 4 protein [Isosphaeraceae bacterium]
MPPPLRSVLLLAERLGVHDDGSSIVPFLDRLQGLGVNPQVLCLEAAGDAAFDHRVVEAPSLAHRWRLPFAVRGLRFGDHLHRPHLLHVLHACMGDVGLAIAEHWKIPYVLTVDEFLSPSGRLRVSRRWCRKLIASSHELADELQTALRVPAGRVIEVNPGIEIPDDPSRPLRRGVAVIGTAGPLMAGSGFATFLNAARRVLDSGLDAEFVIAGQGEDEVDLRRRAERLKIADRVTFAGIPVVGLRFWSVLDAFCQPSLVPSVGRTLATAMGYAVPCIAADIQGLRALIEPGRNGVRVPPGDTTALARAILGLFADPAKAKQLGLEARRMIERDFRPDEESRRLVACYSEAIASEAPANWREIRSERESQRSDDQDAEAETAAS